MLAGKRLLKQAAVLTVSQVRGLHAALVNKKFAHHGQGCSWSDFDWALWSMSK